MALDISRPEEESGYQSRKEQRPQQWARWAGSVRQMKTPIYKAVTWVSLSGIVLLSSTLSWYCPQFSVCIFLLALVAEIFF